MNREEIFSHIMNIYKRDLIEKSIFEQENRNTKNNQSDLKSEKK